MRTELPFVNIVGHMTAAAIRRHVGRAGRSVRVAIVACQSVVAAVERKSGVQVVIERGERPVAAVVAPGTVVAQRLAVRIIVRMTGGAACRRIVEPVARMALAASNCGVQPRQRETGEIVVESGDRQPGRLFVARGAILAELCRVRIVD